MTWEVEPEIEKLLEEFGANNEASKRALLRQAALEMLETGSARPAAGSKSRFGCMQGTLEILGDIVEPLHDEWNVSR